MARKITVAALSPLHEKSVIYGQNAIKHMIGRWQEKLDLVLPDEPDLIVLPECCDRFESHTFPERFEYYRERGMEILDFFANEAKKNNTRIVYSTVWDTPQAYRLNSSFFIGTDGEVKWRYDKNFPMMQGEYKEQNVRPGKAPEVYQSDIGRIGAMICFDLNFEMLLDHYRSQKPELLLFSSMFNGGLLGNIWAYRCRSYFVGATPFCCSVKNPLGMDIATSTHYADHLTAKINLDYANVHYDFNFDKLKALKAFYGQGVTILDPDKLGSVLVTSELNGVSVKDMLKKFDIQTLDDYLAESAEVRNFRVE